MKKTIILLLTALLLIVSVCSAMAELDTENPVLIGYVGALSGDTALWGQAGLNGMELTAKQINEAGGILGREVACTGNGGFVMPKALELALHDGVDPLSGAFMDWI